MKKQSTLIVAAALMLAMVAPVSQVNAQSGPTDPQNTVAHSLDKKDPDAEPKKELIDENYAMHEISVYPNPASDVIHIDFGYAGEGRRRINLYDLLGNNVLSFEHQESGANISIKSLKPGIYILVAGNQSFKIQKI